MSKDQRIRDSVAGFVREICSPFEKFQATVNNIEVNLPSLRKQIEEIKDSIRRWCNANSYANYGIFGTLAATLILAPFTFGMSIPMAFGASTAAGVVSLGKNGVSSISCGAKYSGARRIVESNMEECKRAKQDFNILTTNMQELGNQLINFFPELKTYQSPEILGWNYFYSLATNEQIEINEEFSRSLHIFADRIRRQDNTLLDKSDEAYRAYREMKETMDTIDVLSVLLTAFLAIINLFFSIGDALYNGGTQYLEKVDKLLTKLNEVEQSICKMKEHHITLDKIRKIPVVS